MGEVIRIFGLATAAFGVGVLLVFAHADKGTTAFAPPARYWGVATGLVVEITGITARIALWGQPFNPRDVTFLVINVLIIITVLAALKQGPTNGGGVDG